MLLHFIFFLTVPFSTQLSQNVMDRSSSNFQDMYVRIRVGMINSTFFSLSLNGRCYGTRILAQIAKSWHTHVHSRRCHSTTDGMNAARIHASAHTDTANDPSIPLFKNLANIGPVRNFEFCRRVCALRSALPSILV